VLARERRTSSKSISSVSRRTPYATALYSLPLKLTLVPWVRWPPCASDIPMHRFAGLLARHEDRHVRLRAGVRLDVRVLGAEDFFARSIASVRRRRRTRSRRNSAAPG
jgi:hypothetical protein